MDCIGLPIGEDPRLIISTFTRRDTLRRLRTLIDMERVAPKLHQAADSTDSDSIANAVRSSREVEAVAWVGSVVLRLADVEDRTSADEEDDEEEEDDSFSEEFSEIKSVASVAKPGLTDRIGLETWMKGPTLPSKSQLVSMESQAERTISLPEIVVLGRIDSVSKKTGIERSKEGLSMEFVGLLEGPDWSSLESP